MIMLILILFSIIDCRFADKFQMTVLIAIRIRRVMHRFLAGRDRRKRKREAQAASESGTIAGAIAGIGNNHSSYSSSDQKGEVAIHSPKRPKTQSGNASNPF